MSENKVNTEKKQKDSSFRKMFNIAVAIAAVAFIGHMIVTNIATFLNIMKVLLGFGFVIMIHEFGHFIVAKLSGIKVDAFSIGFPPTILGIRKTEKGMRFRILPCFFSKKIKEGDKEIVDEESGICYTVPSKNKKASDTEYRIGLIPAGGFVAMMGQSDSGAVEESNDPKSYANKSIAIRVAVVSAGVIFNAISAVFIFMTVFSIGLDLPPAIVGDVLRNSPAEKAGLVPGDEIIEVEGETFVDYTSLPMAAALSVKGEPINLVVRRADGSEEPIGVVAIEPTNLALPIRQIGIMQAATTSLPNEDEFASGEAEVLFDITGFKPGDMVTAVNGTAVNNAWDMNKLIGETLSLEATLTVKRDGEEKPVDLKVPLMAKPYMANFEKEYDLAHYFSMHPRIKVNEVTDRAQANTWQQKLLKSWRVYILRQKEVIETKSALKFGDIIVKIADTDNPTYPELKKVTEEHDNKSMAMTVLRKNEDGELVKVDIEVTPLKQLTRSGDGDVTIGFVPSLDLEHPVVANTTAIDGMDKIDIPAGAMITNINGTKVEDFLHLARIFSANTGKEIAVSYTLNDKPKTTKITVPKLENPVDARSYISFVVPEKAYTLSIPFKTLRKIYKADNSVEAIQMGLKKTSMFITQTLITLKGLFTGSVSPKTLSGPLGIVTTSYTIAKTSTMYYLYFLGLISSCIAVMNLLPLPVVDGGVIVLLMIEKIKGSPISIKIQEIISYAGLIMILALFAWLFWNDLLNMIFNPIG